MLRSLEESLARLGTDRLDVVLVHDPDDHEDDALRRRVPDAAASCATRASCAAIGCGMNQTEMLERFVARVDLDCVLLAGRYSLLDRSGAALLDACAARGVGVILGGVFNTGVLATDVDAGATFDYEPASTAILDRTARARARRAATTASRSRRPRSTSRCGIRR